MPGDDDETPPRGWMTDSQRANIGAAHRRRSRSYPLGIPAGQHPDADPDQADARDITDPVILLERELLPEEARIVHAARRDGGESVPYEQFAKLVHRQHEQERRRRKRDTDQVRELAALRAAVCPETVERIDARLTAAEKAQRGARRLVIAALLALGGGLGGGAKLLLEGAERKGADTERLKQTERALDDFRQDLRELRLELGRRSSNDSDVGSLTTPPPSLLTNQGFPP